MPPVPTDPIPTANLPTDRRAMLAGIGGLAAGAILVGKANAGPLNPPAGPVAPTPGPEPRTPINSVNTPGNANSLFKITQSGSYYLTGNITGVAGKSGIEIAADNVTIDMMGFSLIGVPSAGSGITVAEGGNWLSMTIRNGKITEWGKSGVELSFGLSTRSFNAIIENIQASKNGESGLNCGRFGIIRHCVTDGNTLSGIAAIDGLVESCTSSRNGSRGITSALVIKSCTASENGADGLNATSGGVITQSTSSNNAGNGIYTGQGTTISECSAYANVEFGIYASQRCTIVNNSVAYSGLDNIQVNKDCIVRGNVSSSAGILSSGASSLGAGIKVTGANNLIEENNFTECDWGVLVTGANNFITRNTCSNNTLNWSVVANNKCLVVLGLNSGAISGNSGGTSPGSTNPNANYTY